MPSAPAPPGLARRQGSSQPTSPPLGRTRVVGRKQNTCRSRIIALAWLLLDRTVPIRSNGAWILPVHPPHGRGGGRRPAFATRGGAPAPQSARTGRGLRPASRTAPDSPGTNGPRDSGKVAEVTPHGRLMPRCRVVHARVRSGPCLTTRRRRWHHTAAAPAAAAAAATTTSRRAPPARSRRAGRPASGAWCRPASAARARRTHTPGGGGPTRSAGVAERSARTRRRSEPSSPRHAAHARRCSRTHGAASSSPSPPRASSARAAGSRCSVTGRRARGTPGSRGQRCAPRTARAARGAPVGEERGKFCGTSSWNVLSWRLDATGPRGTRQLVPAQDGVRMRAAPSRRKAPPPGLRRRNAASCPPTAR